MAAANAFIIPPIRIMKVIRVIRVQRVIRLKGDSQDYQGYYLHPPPHLEAPPLMVVVSRTF
jgi:hypothetical protein